MNERQRLNWAIKRLERIAGQLDDIRKFSTSDTRQRAKAQIEEVCAQIQTVSDSIGEVVTEENPWEKVDETEKKTYVGDGSPAAEFASIRWTGVL